MITAIQTVRTAVTSELYDVVVSFLYTNDSDTNTASAVGVPYAN